MLTVSILYTCTLLRRSKMTNLEDMTREQLIGQSMYLRIKLSRLEETVPDVVVTTGTKYEDVQPKPLSRYAPRSGPR